MNLNQIKTGDRLWTMLPGPTNENRMNFGGGEYLLSLEPFEVIFLSAKVLPSSTKGEGAAVASCAVVDGGSVLSIDAVHLHEHRKDAICQAISNISDREVVLIAGRDRLISLLTFKEKESLGMGVGIPA